MKDKKRTRLVLILSVRDSFCLALVSERKTVATNLIAPLSPLRFGSDRCGVLKQKLCPTEALRLTSPAATG